MRAALRVCVWVLAAVTLVVGRYIPENPEEPDNGLAHNRTLRHTECYEDEYPLKGNCCRLCPAGTRVSQHCTVNHARGTCQPCTLGKDYTAGPSGLEQCLFCLRCRKDQVLVQECTTRRNAECECKPGYYCLPEEPCEACTRCSSCPEGQRIRERCTATKDTICEDFPGTETTTSKIDEKTQRIAPTASTGHQTGSQAERDTRDQNNGRDWYWEPIVGAVAVAIGIFLVLVLYYTKPWRRGKRPNNGSESSLVATTADPSANSTPLIERNINRTEEQVPEEVQLVANEHEPAHPESDTAQIAESTAPAAVSNRGGYEDSEPVVDDVDDEDEECEENMERPCRECDQPPFCDCQWTDFIYMIVEHVRTDAIVRLIRHLRLNENKIEEIMRDYSKTSEQNYQLFMAWRYQVGKQADMAKVLRILDDMGLGGCCENVFNCLRSKKIPISSSWRNC
ncbi:uncharacterized protein LOC134970330 [Pseudophryne corroboree]|uniref:uncharacterized protein LOC134970330 n=1 Tax=Pseudophryne corroboree TaxID=495146 RepID=UPI00308131CA